MHRPPTQRAPPTFSTISSVPVINRLPFEKCAEARVASTEANLRLNSFKLDLPKDKTINKCELKFWGVYGTAHPVIKDLATGLKSTADEEEAKKAQRSTDVSAQQRRFCITQLYDTLLTAYPEVFQFEMDDMGKYKHIYVYDRVAIYYSDVPVPHRDEKSKLRLNIEALDLDVLGKLRNPSEVYATLKVTEAINLQTESPDSPSVKMFYEVLLCQTQLDGSNWLKFGSRMVDIEDSNAVELDELCVLFNGHSKSVLNYKTEKGNVDKTDLQIDARLTAFYQPISLGDFIHFKTGLRADDDWTDAQTLHRLRRTFKGMFVTTHTYKERSEIFKIDSFSEQGAGDITFTNREGREQSIVDFFLQTYEVNVRFPHLPCVIKKMGTKLCYYPIEFLNVQSGQRYPKEKMKVDQEALMIRRSQRLPQVLIGAIQEQKERASLNNNDGYISSAGVQIGNELLDVTGRVIPPPLITYRSSSKSLSFAEWIVKGDHFVKPAKFIYVAVFFYDLHEGMVQQFCQMLFEHAKRFGINIGGWNCGPLLPQEANKEKMVEKVKYVTEKFKANYVFFLGDCPGFHDIIKSTEFETCVPTQQVMPATVKNVVEKNQFLTLGNILMKMNLKRGGENQYFQQHDHNAAICSGQKFDLFKSFLVNTMILGIDFSHPGPGTPSNELEFHPSVVGFAYSFTDNGNVARGGFRYIKSRQTILSDLNEEIEKRNEENKENEKPKEVLKESDVEEKVSETSLNSLKDILETALEKYVSINGKVPERILVYRSGISGGEKERLLINEAGGMGKIAKKWYEERRKTIPYIIIVGCIRSHGARLFKPDGSINSHDRAPQQNVVPGTAIDFYDTATETLMVPHRALQGTVKPTLFKVLFDSFQETDPSKAIKKEVLDHVTHSLCYMHEIVASAISVPAHLRSAEQMANRGRRLWMSCHGELMEEGHVNYARAAETFNPYIDTRYWA